MDDCQRGTAVWASTRRVRLHQGHRDRVVEAKSVVNNASWPLWTACMGDGVA